MSIKISLILESKIWDVEAAAAELGIAPYEIIKEYPKNSSLGSTWYTQVITDSRGIDEPLKMIQARTMPKIDSVLAICKKYELTPMIQIVVRSDYPNRPEITFEPSDIEFIHLLHAEVSMDVIIE